MDRKSVGICLWKCHVRDRRAGHSRDLTVMSRFIHAKNKEANYHLRVFNGSYGFISNH